MFANTLVKLHIDVIFARRVLLAKNTLWTMLCGIQEKHLIIVKHAAKSIRAKSISLIICARTRMTRRFVVKYAVSNSVFFYLFTFMQFKYGRWSLKINSNEGERGKKFALCIKTRSKERNKFRYLMGRFQKRFKLKWLPLFYKFFTGLIF